MSTASGGSRVAPGERVGLALGYDPKASVMQMAAAAAAAEGRGLEMVFFSETLFSNRDSVSALAAFALATALVGQSMPPRQAGRPAGFILSTLYLRS